MITSPTTIPYRQKDGLNFSSIKVFDQKGPKMFYKEYVMGLREDKETSAILIGNMVDEIITNYGGDLTMFEQEFSDKYVQYDGVKSSAQAFVLADYLFEGLRETIHDGRVTGDFETCFRAAFDRIQAEGKYKGKTWDKGLEDFNKVAKDYFDKKIQNIGKKVVDLNMVQTARNVANQLLTDSFTSSILRGERNTLLNKIEVDFNFYGVRCKAEIDCIEIDHVNKVIIPYDLKCTYDNEDFPMSYIKNGYYLQQAFYTVALESWKKEQGMEDFKVALFRFIVGDTSANGRRPLVYKLTSADLANGHNGFTLRGYQYKGIRTLVDEIKWHMDNDIWDCSREAFIAQGNLTLSINYDDKRGINEMERVQLISGATA